MTERSPRPTRWTKGEIRTLAWVAGAAAFMTSGAALAVSPFPPADHAASDGRGQASPRRVIERRVIRRVVVVHPVLTPSGGASSRGSGPVYVAQPGGGAGGGSSGGAPANPPSPPPTSTGAS